MYKFCMNSIVSTDNKHNILHRRARKWRMLTIFSGLLLASSFFMPAVQSCNKPVVPAMEFYDLVTQVPSGSGNTLYNIAEFCAEICVYFPAYLFGLLLVLAAFGRLTDRKRLTSFCSWCIIILLFYVSVISICVEYVSSGQTSGLWILDAVLGIWTLLLA